jgi:hypothetical protein
LTFQQGTASGFRVAAWQNNILLARLEFKDTAEQRQTMYPYIPPISGNFGTAPGLGQRPWKKQPTPFAGAMHL